MDVAAPAASTPTTRRILFSSFCPAACAVLNWKQPNYAVLFASYCGLSRSTPEGMLQRPNRLELDKRCTSIEGAVKFAKANNLLGVLFDSTIVVSASDGFQLAKVGRLIWMAIARFIPVSHRREYLRS